MFPPNNQNQNANPGGDESNLDQYIQQLVAQEWAKHQQTQGGNNNPPGTPPPAAQNPPVPQPIEVPINGQNYKFNSPEEISQFITRFANEANAAVAAAKQNSGPGQHVTGDDKPTFDLAGFVDKITTNPPDAVEMAIKARTGLSLDDLKSYVEKQNELQKIITAYQFRDAHPEWDPRHAGTLEQIRNSMGLDFSPQGLEAAYAFGVMRGLIQPNQPAQAPGQNPNFAPQGQQDFQPQQPAWTPQQPQFQPAQPRLDPRAFNGGVNFMPQGQFQNAVPRVPRAGLEVTPNLIDMVEDMSPEQIEGLFSQLQGR